jgi:hypothetical protein
MADNTPDNSTKWTSFFTYWKQRAAKIVPDTDREREAKRLIFAQIYNGELELRWQDLDGRWYIGLPPHWFGWYPDYDQSANAIRESPLPFARTLYQPHVRERVQPVYDNQNIGGVLAASEAPHTAQVEGLTASEASDTARVEGCVTHNVALTASEAADTVLVEGHVDNKWIWEVDPCKRKKDGTKPRQVQLACERLEHEGKLKPSIQGLSVSKACQALERAGVTEFGDSDVRRAFGRL